MSTQESGSHHAAHPLSARGPHLTRRPQDMHLRHPIRIAALCCGLGLLLLQSMAAAAPAPKKPAADPRRDGSHDFDAGVGSWHTHIKRLSKPLTGSSTWT